MHLIPMGNGVNMLKIFNAQIWLLIFAVINFIGGSLPLLLDNEGSAEHTWGIGSALAHDPYYEMTIGIMIALLTVLAFGLAFFTSGVARAKMAALLGVSMLLCMIILTSYGNSSGASNPGIILIIPFTVFSGLALSGFLNLKGE